MYCPQCGKQIPDNSKFCKECGGAIPRTTTFAPLDMTQPEEMKKSFAEKPSESLSESTDSDNSDLMTQLQKIAEEAAIKSRMEPQIKCPKCGSTQIEILKGRRFAKRMAGGAFFGCLGVSFGTLIGGLFGYIFGFGFGAFPGALLGGFLGWVIMSNAGAYITGSNSASVVCRACRNQFKLRRKILSWPDSLLRR